MPFAGLCQLYPLLQLVPVTPGRGRRCPTWWWHCGRPLLERRPLSPRPQARGRWAAGDAPTLGLSPPLLFEGHYFIFLLKGALPPAVNLSPGASGVRVPVPPLPGTSSDLATSRTRLVPAGPSEALLGIKGGIRQKGTSSSPVSPAGGGGRGGGARTPPRERGRGERVSPARHSPFPHGPPADFRVPGGMAGPRIPKPVRGCQFPADPKGEQPLR